MERFYRIALALTALALTPASASAQTLTKIEFQHAIGGALGERVGRAREEL